MDGTGSVKICRYNQVNKFRANKCVSSVDPTLVSLNKYDSEQKSSSLHVPISAIDNLEADNAYKFDARNAGPNIISIHSKQ